MECQGALGSSREEGEVDMIHTYVHMYPSLYYQIMMLLAAVMR